VPGTCRPIEANLRVGARDFGKIMAGPNVARSVLKVARPQEEPMNHVLRASALLFTLGLVATPAVAGTPLPGPTPTPTPVPKPVPIQLAPTFSCSVVNIANGGLFTTGTVIVTKTGGGALAANAKVVATVTIPSGKMTTTACGNTFAGTPPKVTLSKVIVPPDPTKAAIYTCSAVVSGTCSSDPPPSPPK